MQPSRRVAPQDNGTFNVYVKAPDFMGTPERCLNLSGEQYARYVRWRSHGGGGIQDFLPDLNADERELLISGLIESEM